MNALLVESAAGLMHAPVRDTAVVLLGTGGVGGALLELLTTPAARRLELVAVANSRSQWIRRHHVPDRETAGRRGRMGDWRDDDALLAALDKSDALPVIVDATASPGIASRHARWLAAGYNVVTANKAVAGGSLRAWQALQMARQTGLTRYGDSATVGAGLPVLSTLRRLHECGDDLLRLEGVFSGSLSWLFSHYDGSRPFSTLLREARELGYTEPDPRVDLSGADVGRKLLILARCAGFAISSAALRVENLVPRALRQVDVATFMDRLDELDLAIETRYAQAVAGGGMLRHIARLDRDGKASVGLVRVSPDHPATHLAGTDNQFALTTTRYPTRPLVIQGPGAGVEVTAQAMLGDILNLRERLK